MLMGSRVFIANAGFSRSPHSLFSMLSDNFLNAFVYRKTEERLDMWEVESLATRAEEGLLLESKK